MSLLTKVQQNLKMDYLIRRLGSEYPDISIIQEIYRWTNHPPNFDIKAKYLTTNLQGDSVKIKSPTQFWYQSKLLNNKSPGRWRQSQNQPTNSNINANSLKRNMQGDGGKVKEGSQQRWQQVPDPCTSFGSPLQVLPDLEIIRLVICRKITLH